MTDVTLSLGGGKSLFMPPYGHSRALGLLTARAPGRIVMPCATTIRIRLTVHFCNDYLR